MFTNGPRSHSTAEDARNQAARQLTAGAQYEANAEVWFDGGLESVDRRLAVCDKLLHQARTAVGVGGFGDPAPLERIASLEADHCGLTELRETFLSAGNYRHANLSQPTMDPMGGSLLSSRDQRYVELEAAKILRANADCRDTEELVERTRRIAAVDTSTFSSQRSRAVTDALSARVVQLAQRRQQPRRMASRSPRTPVIQDFPSELMYF